MARPERFELPTTWFEARDSIQLSYGRIVRSYYRLIRVVWKIVLRTICTLFAGPILDPFVSRFTRKDGIVHVDAVNM